MSFRIGIQVHLKRLAILALPVAYYFFSRQDALFLNTIILAIFLFVAYLKYYLAIKIKPNFLNNIFEPEIKLACLSAGCFLSIFFFSKTIAMNMLLFIVLGNTFADIAKERYGRIGELLVFAYICLSSSLFLLFSPLIFDWHIALLACLAGVVIRLINLPINQDISVALTPGLVMALLLT